MAISSIPSTPIAFRTQTTPAATLNAATQPSSAPQQTGRPHHHHGGGKGGSALTASTSQSSTANGSLLDTLI